MICPEDISFIIYKKAAAIFTISDSFISKVELSSEEREKNVDNMIKIALKTSLNLQK